MNKKRLVVLLFLLGSFSENLIFAKFSIITCNVLQDSAYRSSFKKEITTYGERYKTEWELKKEKRIELFRTFLFDQIFKPNVEVVCMQEWPIVRDSLDPQPNEKDIKTVKDIENEFIKQDYHFTKQDYDTYYDKQDPENKSLRLKLFTAWKKVFKFISNQPIYIKTPTTGNQPRCLHVRLQNAQTQKYLNVINCHFQETQDTQNWQENTAPQIKSLKTYIKENNLQNEATIICGSFNYDTYNNATNFSILETEFKELNFIPLDTNIKTYSSDVTHPEKLNNIVISKEYLKEIAPLEKYSELDNLLSHRKDKSQSNYFSDNIWIKAHLDFSTPKESTSFWESIINFFKNLFS
ncbi:TPA: hypothetical protein DEO28_01940 [Candidatus Dependentiae bacterium]|nr:MAG: hypothetical protein UR14_C0004G0072 [candidate division TM6 bacterium GW2011_GWE2_31_21]KKP52991.1 MAG: hypothetical protein UR43_C0008G0073 [candidate division TM6 bacterium GW2011_GWF2_33_332]HBS47771.1 hypothetical protein [Candidatus Dependentiae bacterium]HBZ73253.1 hypothetical protein [Candidatus Dependentiae bacterium]